MDNNGCVEVGEQCDHDGPWQGEVNGVYHSAGWSHKMFVADDSGGEIMCHSARVDNGIERGGGGTSGMSRMV